MTTYNHLLRRVWQGGEEGGRGGVSLNSMQVVYDHQVLQRRLSEESLAEQHRKKTMQTNYVAADIQQGATVQGTLRPRRTDPICFPYQRQQKIDILYLASKHVTIYLLYLCTILQIAAHGNVEKKQHGLMLRMLWKDYVCVCGGGGA